MANGFKLAEAYAESIIDTIREALIVVNENLRVAWANRSFYSQFKVTKQDTENHLIYELGNGQWDIPALRYLLEKIMLQHTFFDNYEVQHHFESIGDKVMLLNARQIVQNEGQKKQILLAIEDIIDRWIARQALTESEERYHNFVENLNSIIIGFDRNGIITFFNHFSEKLFGYNRAEVIGKPFIGTILAGKEQSGKDNSTLCQDIYAHPENYYAVRSEATRKDGSRVRIAWSVKLQFDRTGNSEVIVDGNDITEWVEELEEKTGTLHSLLEFIPEGILIADKDNGLRYVSQFAGELFGLSAEDIIRTPAPERPRQWNLRNSETSAMLKPEDLPLSQAMEKGSVVRVDKLEVRRPGTSVRYVSISAAPIFDSAGNILGAISVWRDVTYRENLLADSLRQKNLLQKIINHAPFVIALLQCPDFRIVFANPEYHLFALGKTAPLGKKAAEILQEPAGVIKAIFNEVCTSGKPYSAKDRAFDFIRDQGHERVYLSFDVIPLFSAAGAVESLLVILSDTTAAVLQRRQIEEDRSRLHTIINSIADEVWIVNNRKEITLVNEAAWNAMGFNHREDFWHDLPGAFRELEIFAIDSRPRPADQAPLVRSLGGEVIRSEPEVLKCPKTGRMRFREVSSAPLYNGDAGIIGAVAVARDVTELRQNVQDALEGKRILETIMQSVPSVIIIAQNGGKVLNASSSLSQLVGVPFDRIKGDVEHPEQWGMNRPGSTQQAQYYDMPICRVMETRQPIQDEEWVLRMQTGEQINFAISARPVFDSNGKVIAAVCSWHNITDRLKAQDRINKLNAELLRRTRELTMTNQELEAFSFSVAHDLRNPLRIMQGFIDFLIEECSSVLNDECKDYVRRIADAAKRMDSIIDDLLALSKISRSEMELQELDLSNMARLSIKELAIAQPQRRVTVAIQDGLFARADARLMSVALGNLLGNAWKYTGKIEYPQIEFGAFTQDNQLIYYVKENGAGFDMNQVGSLFVPFKRLHSEREFKGTGVGLAIVERAIKRHGGKIWAEGAVGKGATFYFTLGT